MRFTVLMPIHDLVELKLLKKAIYSILNSNKIPNEFLIMIDGDISTDKIT